jgi:hypothetical protein
MQKRAVEVRVKSIERRRRRRRVLMYIKACQSAKQGKSSCPNFRPAPSENNQDVSYVMHERLLKSSIPNAM